MTARGPNKLLGLEVTRFFSAMAVLLWHYQHFSYLADKPVGLVRSAQPFYALLSPGYTLGYWGVQVFWSISGFIFFWKYRATIASQAIGGMQFLMLRFSRLYPLHLLTLLAVAVLQLRYLSQRGCQFVYQFNDLRHFLLQIFMASNWGFEKGYSFDGPIWSISVEVLVYCCFFLILRFIASSPLVNIGVLTACVVAMLGRASTPLVDCLGFFYAGGLSAILASYCNTDARHRRCVAAACALLLLAIPLFATALIRNWLPHTELGNLLLLCVLPPYLFIASGNVPLPTILRSLAEAAGNMTYSSYLLHFPLQLLLVLVYSSLGRTVPMYDARFFIGYMAVTLLLSFLTYQFFELPMQTFLRQWYRRTIQRRLRRSTN